MPAGKYDFFYEQGSDLSFTITYQNEEAEPIDLTGYSVRGQIRPTFQSPIFYNLTFEIPDATTGQIIVRLPRAELETLDLSGKAFSDRTPYVYDIELIAPDETVTRLLNGRVQISPEATK
jgi:hypothetical protein